MAALSCQGCGERDVRIADLEARVAALESQCRDQARLLVDRARKLPNKDLPTGAAPQATKASGRKPGGQPGHPPHLKHLLPPERVTQTIPLVPTHWERCQTPLPVEPGPDDPAATRFHVAELPDLKAKVTEYQRHSRTCPCCGQVNPAPLPADFPTHRIAPGLAALMAYLVGACGLSKRRVEEVVETVFAGPVALGTGAKLEQELSAALEPAPQEALAAVQQAPVKHLDETGWKKAGHKRWLWVAATRTVVVLRIHRLRNAAVRLLVVGRTLHGILCSDRWRAYDGLPLFQRQICWAHLKRNWEKLRERGGAAQRLADACLASKDVVFEQWHRVRGGGLTRSQLDDRLAPLALELLAVRQHGERSRDGKTARFCRRVLAVYPAWWTFGVVEGVEPTTNHAERVQRLAVWYRTNCLGCHSDAGGRFVERLLTVVQTFRLQKRPVLNYRKATLIAHRTGQAKPTLAMEG